MDNKYKVLAECQWQSIEVRRESLRLGGPEDITLNVNRRDSPPSDLFVKFVEGIKKFSQIIMAGTMVVASV